MTEPSFTHESLPLVVILLGPPGAGKGTHAGPLSHQLKLPHISTGDLFRENMRELTPLGLVAKTFIDKGLLVPDELVFDMLFHRTGQSDCKNGYILDGFPRTLPQAQLLDARLKDNSRLVVVNLALADETIVKRVTGRIACKKCGRPYHKVFDPPQNQALCACGGALHQRDDDREEIIRKRLEVYHKQTQPLIEYYALQKEVFHEIDSQKGKAEVFQAVLDIFAPLVHV